MDHDAHPRLAPRGPRCCPDGGRVVRIAANVEAQLSLRPCIQQVPHRRADHVVFVPGRDDRCGRPGNRAPFDSRSIDPGRANTPAHASDQIERVDRELIESTEKKEKAREQKQFVLEQDEPVDWR